MNETKEFEFQGTVISGFVMLGMFFVLLALAPFLIIRLLVVPGVICAIAAFLMLPGFVLIEPNNLRV
ncbi:MAG: SPFH domain-containing protein, partial [Tannerellaceae bacterium]